MKRGYAGRELEDAVALACVSYKRKGRGDIRKTAATSRWVGGRVIWTKKGDTDFVGDADGRPIRIECKETHEASLPLASLAEHQADTLSEAHARGCMALLIVRFAPGWRCYSLEWSRIASFMAAPWRRSITEDMCQAWGRLIPVATSPSGKIGLRFLEALPHFDCRNAETRVEAERASTKPREYVQPNGLPGFEFTVYDVKVKPRERPPVDPFGPDAYKRAKRLASKEAAKVKKW